MEISEAKQHGASQKLHDNKVQSFNTLFQAKYNLYTIRVGLRRLNISIYTLFCIDCLTQSIK